MFGISMQELILVLVVALNILGPKKLPDAATSPEHPRGTQRQGAPMNTAPADLGHATG
jgi:Sec-independent protein translocase protein TatA